MAKSTITREQITSWMNDANYALEEPLNADDAAAARAILAMGHELLAAMDQKPALHRYRRKAVEPYGPYPWHYEVFVDYPRPVECIEDEYFYAAPPVVTGFAVDGEPVAWLLSGGGAKNVVCFDSGNAYADPLREVTPLYRHAQPAPVAYSDFEEFWSAYIHPLAQDDELKDFAWDIWNACRAAMLAAAPQEVK